MGSAAKREREQDEERRMIAIQNFYTHAHSRAYTHIRIYTHKPTHTYTEKQMHTD